MEKRITNNNIQHLNKNQIFVFGSNESGRHGAGAAKLAMNWGAEYGNPEGLQGKTYAIPTKNKTVDKTLTLEEIKIYVNRFIAYAKKNQHLHFFVTEIGCGLAGLSTDDVGPLFKNCEYINNISLPKRFWNIIKPCL